MTPEQIAAEAGDTFIEFKNLTPVEQWERIVTMLHFAGYGIHEHADITKEWWCLTHLLPGDRDLNDLDAMRRRCFAHRLNWDRPLWLALKCRMVQRTVLIEGGGRRMSEPRVVVLCEHGAVKHDEYGRELTGCDGGRVLEPGSYVLVEKVDGEWQVPIRLGLHGPDGGPVNVDEMFDYLAQAQAGGERP